MRKVKGLTVTFLTILLCLIFNVTVYGAAKFSMSIGGASQVTVGNNITLTMTGEDLAGVDSGFDGYQGTMTYDSTYLTYVGSSGSISGWKFKVNTSQANKIIILGYDEDAPDNKKTTNTELFKITFKANKVGSTQVGLTDLKGSSANGASLTASPVTKTITIVDETPVTPKSSDANLSNLSVSGHAISPSFSPATTAYTLTVGNGVTSLDVSAITSDSKAKVSISGNKNLSVGKNNIIVEVTAEDGNKKTYTITVTREQVSTPSNGQTTPSTPSTPKVESKSSNANLAAVYGIDNMQFDPNKNVYNVTLPFEDSSLDVSAIAESSKAKVTISNGKIKKLEVGKPYTTTITVQAEDGSIKVYTFNVTRSNIKGETDLKELKVNGEDVLKDGEKDIYTVKVPKDTEKIDISAIPKSSGSIVKIKGKTTLKDGTNTIVVEVTDKNGFTKSYTVNVERKTNAVFAFFKKWWPWLLGAVVLSGVLAFLIYSYNKNRLLIAAIDKERQEEAEKTVNNIDDRDIIVYNYNSHNVTTDDDTITNATADEIRAADESPTVDDDISTELVPKHAKQDDKETINNLLDDDLVSEVSKEIKVVRDTTDEDLEKEYKIIEVYRKK